MNCEISWKDVRTMADTSTGWVKLFRSFTKWGWYTDVSVKVVYLHLILTANSKDTIWNGVTIKRGQLVTSYRNLGADVGLDVHSTHRAVKKLCETGEISVQSNAKFSIITLNNYDSFQGSATVKQRSSNSQATSEQSTKEYKNNKNKKEDTPPADSACAENGAEIFTGWKAREGHDF